MKMDYIVNLTGNIDKLEKVIKKAQGQVKRISDDEVLIKLDYDGNYAAFNKTFKQMLKNAPELTVQFQYDVNKKILDQEMAKLQQMASIKLDIESGNANTKLQSMLKSLNDSWSNDEHESILHSKMSELLKYANTLSSLGYNVDKSVLTELEDIADGYKSLDALLQKNELEPLTLFKIDKNLDETIANTTHNVETLTKVIDDLKKKGASDLSDNDEFKQLSDRVKVLASDLEDMKKQLGNLSGEAFDEMSRSVDTLEGKLSNALTRLQELREATVNPNDITYHIGSFEEGPHRLKSESYNHIISNMNLGGFDEGDFGYGILGTGVYHTPDVSELKIGGANKKGYAIDLSKYKLFVANLDEEAERLMTFLGQMQGFVVAQGSSYREWDDILKKKNVNSETLYTQFKNIFGNTVMSVQEFEGFLDEMIAQMNEISAGGLQVGEKAGDFKDLPAKYDHFDTAITQLMKRLGYEGIDFRGTQYDNYDQGNTIFDLHPEDVIKTFNTQEELDTYWENNKKAIEKFNTASAQALGEAGKNIKELTGYVETLSNRLDTLAEKVNGLSNLGAVQDAGELLAGAAVEGIKEGQHSHSPSVDGEEQADNLVDGYVNETNARVDDAFKAGQNLSSSAVEGLKAGLTEESTGQLAFIERVASSEEELGQAMAETASKAKEASEQIEGQLSLDFSKATSGQEKYELAIVETNNELQRMAELAFRADMVNPIDAYANQSQLLKAQEAEQARIANEEAQRAAQIAKQNEEYARQQELIRGAAEAAFRMDTGQTGTNQLNQLLSESYKETQRIVDETVRATQAQMEQAEAIAKQNSLAKNFGDAISDYADEISRAEGNAEELAASLQKAMDVTRKADAAGSSIDLLGDIQEEIRQSDAARESIDKLLKKIAKLEDVDKYTTDFVNSVYQVKASLESLSHEDIITPEQVSQLEAAVSSLEKASKADVNKNFKELSRTKYLDQISQYLAKYTGLSKETRAEIEKIAEAMRKANSAGELKELYGQFVKLKTEARDAGEEVQSMFTNIGHRLDDMNAKFIAQFLSWQDLLRYARQAVDVINELDYALVDLKKTTTMSSSELKDFYYSSNDVAKSVGVTTKEIIDQAAAWSRLGYSSKEEATEMAALSSQFAQISPGMDVDAATDGLVSTMKAFHVDVADVETEIMDVINKTGNTMATTNEEVVEMLKRSSAAMSAANNSIKETIALESAAVQITRNAETTGTAFRTISMRIRGYDEETEEYIGGIEELTGKIADLTKTAKTPGGISLFTDETKTTYKSTYQILKDISEIYNELSDADQAALLETLAGKRGGQVLAGILEDFSEVERAMGNMETSLGSADAEMSIVEESITYKLNNLQQTWVGILQELIDNGMLGQLIDALTAISEVLGEIITTVGPVGTAIAGIGLKQLIVDADKLPQILKTVTGLIDAVGTANEVITFDNATESTQEVLLNLEGIEDVFGSVTEAAETTSSAVETIGEVAGGSGVSGATKLASAFKALVPILTNPITIMAALAVATYALYKYVDGANDRQRDKVKDLEKEYSSLAKEFDSTIAELERTNKQIDEIQSKGTISLVEQQELERLRTQAELLKIAKQEQEELLKLKAQELTGENQKLFDKVYGDINAGSITNPEDRIQGYDQTVNGATKFSYGEQLSSALESAAKGDYNDSPNELLAIFQQIQEAREGALKTIEEYGSKVTKLNEEELAAFEGAKEVIADTDQYMSGLQIQIGKVKTELLNMRTDAARAGTDEGNALVEQINNALKLVYQYSGTSREWNAMQIGSIFDNTELEITRQELESIASAGELSEDTLKQYPKLKEAINGLNLILGEGETAWALFKNEMLASAEAANQVDDNLGDALEAAKSWETERNAALEKLGLAKEGRDGIEYDDSWTKYLETIKQLNPELANNEEELEKCALANMQFSHAVDDLSQNFKTYKEALQDANALTPEYSNAINALADDLTYLTGINFSISEASDFLADANNLELLEQAINGSDEALQQLQQHASQSIRIKIDTQSLTELRTTTTKALQDVKNELAELGKGGNVDLTLRPKIDTQLLRDVGWDKVEEVAGEYATVFTKTFTNEAGDVAVNFTPIIVDENGNYVDVMEPDAFTRYCEGVIAGTQTDDLNLQIGAEFTGEHAVEEAEAAAIRIHNLHELQIELGLDTDEFNAQFTSLVNWLETADLGTLEAQTYINEDPFIQALIHLANESEEMAAKIKQIFAELGWDIKWDTTKMKVPKPNGSHITSTYAKDAYGNPIGPSYVRWDWEELDVPTNIHFEKIGGSSSRRSSTSGYTPKSMSPSQKSGAKSNIDKANGGSGGSDKDKEDDYKETIDFFERLIKVLDQKVSLLEAHLQDVVGSFAKNTLLDAEENVIRQKMDSYSSALEMYSAKASETLAKIPADIAAKVQNGSVSIQEFIGEDNKELVEAIQDYEGWADKVAECKQQIVELREALRQLELTKFKNIAQDFQEIFDVRQTQIDLISKAIDLFETARDKIVGRGFYDESIEQKQKQLNSLLEKRVALNNQMTQAIANGVNVAGDEWFEMLDAVEKVNGEILDAQKSIEEYKNAIIQLYVDAFDRESNRYSRQISLRQKAIDALERQISVISSAGNVAGRAFYDEQISQTAKQIVMLEEERRELERRLDDAISNGVKVGTTEWYNMVDAINEVDAAIQSANQSIEEYKNSIVELYMELFNRESERYNNQIALRQKSVEALEKQIAIVEAAGNVAGESFFKEQIEQTQKQIDMLEAERKALMQKMSDATANGVDVGTEEWYSMVDALNEVDSAIQDATASIEEMDNAILALHTETFDRIQNRYAALVSEMSNMAESLSDEKVATTDNKWTREGLAQLGLQAQQYELAKKQVDQYNQEIDELNKQYANGKYSVIEYTTKLAELKEQQWASVKSAQAAKDSIVDLNKARVEIVVEGIEKEIDAYKKLIDAQKDTLSAEKELRDYEKSIAESQKDITSLENQLAALSDDDSRAAIAKRKQLEEKLAEAREELAEKEYDHSISAQQEALAKQAEDYEAAREIEIENLQATLEETETLIADTFNTIKENALLIGEELLLMAQNLNITMSPEITAPWQAGETAIAAYSELFNIESSAFMERLAEVEVSEWKLQEQANNSSLAISNMFGNRADELVAQTNIANDTFREEEQAVLNASAAIAENFSKRADELVASTDAANAAFRAEEEAAWNASRAIADAFGNRADELVATIENARNSAQNLSAMSDALANSLSNSIDGAYSGAGATSALNSIADAANGVAEAANEAAGALRSMLDAQNAAYSRSNDSSQHVTTIYGGPHAGQTAKWQWNSNGQISNIHYAKGTKGVQKNQVAWTQEDGSEMILSPSTGAILTPLQKGDAVLPTDKTANIWEWSKFNPTDFAKKLIQNVPNTGGNIQTNTMQVGSLVTVNGNVNDTMEMIQIASTTAATKIKQSFNELSNGLNK